MKERRGPRDFLVRAPDQALQGRGGSHGPSPQHQLWGTPPGRGSPPGVPRAAGRSPARALPPSPAAGDPAGPPAPRRWPRGPGGVGAHPGGHRAAALTDLVRHRRPLVTAPHSPRPSGAARAAKQTGRGRAGDRGPKGGAGRAGRGGGGPRPGLRGRLAPCPARCRCGRAEPGSAAPRAARPQL